MASVIGKKDAVNVDTDGTTISLIKMYIVLTISFLMEYIIVQLLETGKTPTALGAAKLEVELGRLLIRHVVLPY